MLAYISQNADSKITEALKQDNFEVRLLAPFSALDHPTDTHADMLLLDVNGKIFKHEDYLIDGEFESISEPMGAKYPNDVPLNIAVVGSHAFCNVKRASKTVLKYLEDNGYTIHRVAQGYAHCSTCIVSDKAIITADDGIYTAACEIGIDALLIAAGSISLPPYGYGFIGGASGVTDDAVYFCGSLEYHPDGERIRAFIEKYGKRVVELYDAPLTDVGGILFK
ncbi:MAG: hypothetical protein IJ360_04585 [Clostridia bacterium]|nr:hypothetical protein [Clostridia bacterium]